MATLTATSNTTVERSGDPFVETGGAIQDQSWTINNMTGGNITFSRSFTGSPSFPLMLVIVVTGQSPTSPVDAQTPTAAAASLIAFGSAFTCASITTSVNNELLLSISNMDEGGTLTAGTTPQPMTVVNTGSGIDGASEWGTAVTAGSNTVGWNYNNTAGSLCEVMAVH